MAHAYVLRERGAHCLILGDFNLEAAGHHRADGQTFNQQDAVHGVGPTPEHVAAELLRTGEWVDVLAKCGFGGAVTRPFAARGAPASAPGADAAGSAIDRAIATRELVPYVHGVIDCQGAHTSDHGVVECFLCTP